MAAKEEARKEDILKASIRVFSKEGFYNARMEDIAVAAGVGKGTIYEYFPSKKVLFQEMMRYAVEMYIAEIERYIAGVNDAKEVLSSFMRFNIDFMREHAEIAKVVINQPNEINEEIMEMFMNMRHRIEEAIASVIIEGISSGCFRKIKPHIAAMTFLAIVSRVAAATLYNCYDGEHSADEALDIFFYGISMV
jgi:AcrR family transcriptional regulator